MRWRRQLSTKFLATGVLLLVLALVSIGLTMWVTRQLDGGAAAVNEAGRMRMQTWRLTSAVQAQLPPAEVQALVASIRHARPGADVRCEPLSQAEGLLGWGLRLDPG